MRVVLDTNVLVSGLLSESGPPGWIVDMVLSGDLRSVFDERMMGEYRDVLARPELKLPATDVKESLTAIERLGLKMTVRPWPLKLPDPDDESFLAVAGAANVTLVSGNLRHFPTSKRAGVSVLTPRQFLDLMRRNQEPPS